MYTTAAMKELTKFIDKKKKVYKDFKKVFCPFINGDVEFTSSGFNHLIWKTGMDMRSSEVIIERLSALEDAVHIISKSATLQEYENNGKEFLCFIAIINTRKYKVIITKTGDNRYKFVSVIPKWKTGKRDGYSHNSLQD